MEIKNFNYCQRDLNLKCNNCGNDIKIKKNKEFICPICKKYIDINIAYDKDVNIQSESYYIYMSQCAIINNDNNEIEYNNQYLEELESKNEIFLYLNKKIKIIDIKDKDNLDFIVQYMIIENANMDYDTKIKEIKKTKYKEEYIKKIENKEESSELKENLFNNSVEIKYYDKIKTNDLKLALFYIGISILVMILIRVLSKFMFDADVLFPSTIIISICPSILLFLGITKLLKIKVNILKVIIYVLLLIIIFIIISFILTIHLSEGTFINRINDYIYHLLHCFEEISEAINRHYEGE